MSLVIILCALLLERLVIFICPLRAHTWLAHYTQKITLLSQRNTYLSLPLSVISIPIIVFFAQIFLSRISFGWAGWIFSLVVLMYCLGNTRLCLIIHQYYQQLELGNIENARKLLAQHFAIEPQVEVTPSLLLQAFYRTALQRIFSILFWFILLGAIGAVLYRVLQKLADYTAPEKMGKVKILSHYAIFVLDWIPARLLVVSFCLAGDFMKVFTELRSRFSVSINDTYSMLYRCGYIANGIDSDAYPESSPESAILLAQFDQAYYLVCRSLFIWLVVLALIILF